MNVRTNVKIVIVLALALSMVGCSHRSSRSADISPRQQVDWPNQANRTVQLIVNYYWSPRVINDCGYGFIGGPLRWLPPNGKKWVVVNLTVLNNTRVREYISSYDIDLVCNDGRVYSARSSIWAENDERIRDFVGAELIPGGYASGDLVYSVELFAKPMRLEYNGG